MSRSLAVSTTSQRDRSTSTLRNESATRPSSSSDNSAVASQQPDLSTSSISSTPGAPARAAAASVSWPGAVREPNTSDADRPGKSRLTNGTPPSAADNDSHSVVLPVPAGPTSKSGRGCAARKLAVTAFAMPSMPPSSGCVCSIASTTWAFESAGKRVPSGTASRSTFKRRRACSLAGSASSSAEASNAHATSSTSGESAARFSPYHTRGSFAFGAGRICATPSASSATPCSRCAADAASRRQQFVTDSVPSSKQ